MKGTSLRGTILICYKITLTTHSFINDISCRPNFISLGNSRNEFNYVTLDLLPVYDKSP